MSLTVDAIVGSTGLELKSDPGVPYVYAGFGGAPSGPWSLTAGSAWALRRPCCSLEAHSRQRRARAHTRSALPALAGLSGLSECRAR